jgi:hypothetical protein
MSNDIEQSMKQLAQALNEQWHNEHKKAVESFASLIKGEDEQ